MARTAVFVLCVLGVVCPVTARDSSDKRESNFIEEIVYQNANHMSQKDLEEITGLRKGEPLDADLVRQAGMRIEEHLKYMGRYFAHVSIVEGEKPGDRRVVFNITEGPVVRLRKTVFVGNKGFNSGQLHSQIDTGRPVLFVTGRCPGFRLATVDNDVGQLERFYKDHGHLDVRVTRELQFTPDFGAIDVIFHIHEGQRYRVEGVSVKGGSFFTSKDLLGEIRIRVGDYYDDAVIKKDVDKITGYYGWRGFQANVSSCYIPQGGRIWIVYSVAENIPGHIGSIWFPVVRRETTPE